MRRGNRFQIADIGIGGDQHPVGCQRAFRRLDLDLVALAADRRRLGIFINAGARGLGHFCQADQEFQRMDMAGAGIAHAAIIILGADPLFRLRLVHEGHVRIVIAFGGDLSIGAILALMSRFV
ncbi:hypothetical protein D3C80_653680 [compost metagenome]